MTDVGCRGVLEFMLSMLLVGFSLGAGFMGAFGTTAAAAGISVLLFTTLLVSDGVLV